VKVLVAGHVSRAVGHHLIRLAPRRIGDACACSSREKREAEGNEGGVRCVQANQQLQQEHRPALLSGRQQPPRVVVVAPDEAMKRQSERTETAQRRPVLPARARNNGRKCRNNQPAFLLLFSANNFNVFLQRPNYRAQSIADAWETGPPTGHRETRAGVPRRKGRQREDERWSSQARCGLVSPHMKDSPVLGSSPTWHADLSVKADPGESQGGN
jgi:hypothetical protein